MESKSLKLIRNELIVILAKEGCSTTEIQRLLEQFINETISLRQIQRILKVHGLARKPLEESPLPEIEAAIVEQIEEPGGSLLGYRGLWNRLRTHCGEHLTVKRNTVMVLMALLDPESTAQRKSRRLKRRIYRNKGPNFLWHLDGYDKLKPYGLPIHGCIDGYSRKVLWLEIADSTSNPKYIAHYYLKCVKELGGCPTMLRTDRGTENCNVAFLQPLLRSQQSEPDDYFSRSHIYGKSISNQRIESFWSQFRKHYMEWWINFFKIMLLEGHFNPSIPFHVDTVRYTFGVLLKKELKKFTEDCWNNHRIRRSKMAETPPGIPNVLFSFPELQGCCNYICRINDENVYNHVEEFCEEPQLVPSSYTYLANTLKQSYNLPNPINFQTALELYFSLIEIIDSLWTC